ncbi:MAG: aldo/keto reductase [Myxococcota bacterium]
MQRAGKVRQLGLCNVKAADVRTALRVLPEGALVSVQNELSPFEPEAALEVLALTRAHGIAFLAHRALGGYRGTVRITKRPSLYAIGERHRSSASGGAGLAARARATLIPLFGATKVESVEGSVEALRLALTEEDMRVLDDAFPAVALRHAGRAGRGAARAGAPRGPDGGRAGVGAAAFTWF